MRIDGDTRTKLALKTLQLLMPKAAAKVMNTTMVNVQRLAKQGAPVDTGRLRASIHFSPTRPNPRGRMTTRVTVRVHYGIHVEFGTSRMKAQPFLGPAFATERPKFLPRIVRAMVTLGRQV